MAATARYDYVPHPHTLTKLRHRDRPVSTTDQLPHDSPSARFNTWLAVKVTRGVGTMWCAYVFAGIALVGLPAAVNQAVHGGGALPIVQWVAQTFLQLVLLSVIIVGQNVLAAAADKRAEATYHDADALLHEAVKIQEHLAAQDKVLSDVIDRLEARGA